MNAYDILIKSYRRNMFSQLRTFKRWLAQSKRPEKLYGAGLLLLLLSAFPFIGILINPQDDFFISLFLLFSFGSYLSCAIGFLYEVVEFLKNMWKTVIGKFTLSGLASLAAFISSIYAQHKINLILGSDPSHFQSALRSITIIFTPFAWIVILEVALLMSYVFSLLQIFAIQALHTSSAVYIFSVIQNNRYYCFLFNKKVNSQHNLKISSSRIAKVVARIIANISLILLLCVPLVIANQNSSFVDKGLANLIVITNFYSKNSCKIPKKYLPGEAYAFIGDGMIITAIPNKNGGYTFEPPRKCNQGKIENQVKNKQR
jgi:hypothetical protein